MTIHAVSVFGTVAFIAVICPIEHSFTLYISMAIAYIELAYNECSHTADLRWPHRQAAHSHCRYTPSVSIIFGWPSFSQFQKHLFFACCLWWISAYLGGHVFLLAHVVVIVLENSGLDQLTFPSSLWTAWGEIRIHFSHAFLRNLLPEGALRQPTNYRGLVSQRGPVLVWGPEFCCGWPLLIEQHTGARGCMTAVRK